MHDVLHIQGATAGAGTQRELCARPLQVGHPLMAPRCICSRKHGLHGCATWKAMHLLANPRPRKPRHGKLRDGGSHVMSGTALLC